jgi:hypothetical protein
MPKKKDSLMQIFNADGDPLFIELQGGNASWLIPSKYKLSDVKYLSHLTDEGNCYFENMETTEVSWSLPPIAVMSDAARENALSFQTMNRSESEDALFFETFPEEDSIEQMAKLDEYFEAEGGDGHGDGGANHNNSDSDDGDNDTTRKSTSAATTISPVSPDRMSLSHLASVAENNFSSDGESDGGSEEGSGDGENALASINKKHESGRYSTYFDEEDIVQDDAYGGRGSVSNRSSSSALHNRQGSSRASGTHRQGGGGGEGDNNDGEYSNMYNRLKDVFETPTSPTPIGMGLSSRPGSLGVSAPGPTVSAPKTLEMIRAVTIKV